MTQEEMAAYWRLQNEGVQDLSGPIGNGYGTTPQGFSGRTGYERAIMDRNKQQEDITEVRNLTGSEKAAKGLGSPEAAAAVESAAAGNGVGAVGSGMMAAGAATANPYLMAGGLGLKVVSAGEQNKRANQEKQRQAYNDRIAQRQQQMNAIGKIAIV